MPFFGFGLKKKYRVSSTQFYTKNFIWLPIKVGRKQNFEDFVFFEDFEDLDYFEVNISIESSEFIENIKLQWSKIESCCNEYSIS